MIATSPDGQWAVIRRGRELSLLAGGAGPASARIELASDAADLAIVGPPSVIVAVTRGEPGPRLVLYQPPYLDAVARLDLDAEMRIAAITGPRVVLVSPDGKLVTIVRIAGRALSTQTIDPQSPVEFAVGLERNQVLFGLLRKLEAWDAVSGRPLLRMQLALPPPPRVLGPAQGHVWAMQAGGDAIVVSRLSDGRPFHHPLGVPIDEVVYHPASPLLVLATAHGLVRLHCFAHSLTAIDAPWRPGMSLAQLVVGDDVRLLGIADEDDEPWRVPIGGAGASAVPPETAAAPAEPGSTAAGKLRTLRERTGQDGAERGAPSERFDRAEKFERPGRSDRAERFERTERPAFADRPALAQPAERPQRPAFADRPVLVQPTERPAYAPSAERPQRPAFAQPDERSAPAERPAPAQSAERPAYAQSDERTALAQPAERPAYARSDERTALAQPAERPAYARSDERTALAQPAERPAYARSDERTALAQPAERPARPAFAQPDERSAPAERPAPAQPAERPARAERFSLTAARSAAAAAPVPLMPAPLTPVAAPLTSAPAPLTSAPAPLASAPASPAPGATRSHAWREPLAVYGAELARGGDAELPEVATDSELGQLAQRLGLPIGACRALTALYSLYLIGEPAAAIARLARALDDWTEPLGQGDLAQLAMLKRRGGKIALRGSVTDLLDGAGPRSIRMVGDAAAVTRPGAARLPRDGRSDLVIEHALAAQLGRIAVIEGATAPGLLEARLRGATAIALAPPATRPLPWPRDAALVVVAELAAPAWVTALPVVTDA